MGMDFYGYVGAFARVPTVEAQETNTIYRCSGRNCINHKGMSESNAFCSKCGSRGEKFTETVNEKGPLNWMQFTEKYFSDPEVFWCNEEGIIMPNRSFGGTLSFSDRDDDTVKSINVKEIEKTIEEFKQHFQPFADKIKELYGKEVQVEYGVITYYG